MIAIKKELRRKTDRSFLHYRKPVVVELLPGDVIRLRLYGQRTGSAVSIEIHELYYELVRRRAATKRAERVKARNERRKQKRLQKYARSN